jgi:hypothetical protein
LCVPCYPVDELDSLYPENPRKPARLLQVASSFVKFISRPLELSSKHNYHLRFYYIHFTQFSTLALSCLKATMLSQARLTLLCLPSETRFQILETVLLYPSKDGMTFVCSWSSTRFKYCWGSRLLRTCRTRYREAVTVLYGKPLFSFVTKYRSLRHEVHFFSARIAENVAS